MGMYDNFDVSPFDSGGFVCANGHEVVELQTKSLDCGLDRYVLMHGRLMRDADVVKVPHVIRAVVYASCPVCGLWTAFELTFQAGVLVDKRNHEAGRPQGVTIQ